MKHRAARTLKSSLFIAFSLALTNASFAHVLESEGDDFLTTDICETQNIIIASPNTTSDFSLAIPDDRPLIVLVPGTNAEDGCAKQFRSIIAQYKDGENIVSLNYYKENLWNDLTEWNARKYDDSVALGVKALEKLLDNTEADDIRVFGHSKGSHIVSHVAESYESDERIKFWAFAQPQRVTSDESDHNKGALGKRGYIEKSTVNLVTINWHNDEVWYFNKKGFGAKNAWKYPGEVNDPETSGGWNANRFDHHNNYGGHYKEKTCPYFPTGDDSRYNDPDEGTKNKWFCDIRDVEFHPYFWGDQRCFDLAIGAHFQPEGIQPDDPEAIWTSDSVNNGTPGIGLGQKHYIGTSGPRGPDCKPLAEMEVGIHIRYRFRYRRGNDTGFSIRFRDFNKFEADGSVAIAAITKLGKDDDSGEWIDTPWHSKMLPNSFIFQIDPLSSGAKNSKNNTIDIAWVKARFNDPRDPSKKIYRYIIGPQCTGRFGGFPCNDHGATPFEGQDQAVGKLEESNTAGWNQFEYRNVAGSTRKDVSNWRMKKSTARRGSQFLEVLRFTGDADGSSAGFYKFYSLMD